MHVPHLRDLRDASSNSTMTLSEHSLRKVSGHRDIDLEGLGFDFISMTPCRSVVCPMHLFLGAQYY